MSQEASNPFSSNVNGKSAIESVAAREHVAQDRPARAHVVITYDFDMARHRLITDVFGVSSRLDEATKDYVHRQLVQDVLDDIATYRARLDDIERWARAQLTKRPTPVRP